MCMWGGVGDIIHLLWLRSLCTILAGNIQGIQENDLNLGSKVGGQS